MLWWRILMLLSLLQGIERTTCLNFNMKIADYAYGCLYESHDCSNFISTKIEFRDSPSCAGHKHTYDCICCEIDTCSLTTCSCLHERFSPDKDSKLMSYKTPENTSFATIMIAVHETTDFMTEPIPMSTFCADQPLSIGEKVLTLHPNRRKKDSDITLQFNITADVVTTTVTTTETTEQIPQAVTGATNVTTIDNNGRKNTTETEIKAADPKSHNGGLIGGVTVGAVALLIAISTIVTVFLCKHNISRWNTRKRRIARKRKRSNNRIYPES